ncbi:MAG: alpha/beta hydrolase [Propionibacteriaceae bacterium]|jgi:pimeloyl-ACP methyl ester carboxylesterase|nr:alpha/beta hydrolase [Propionibacteriaceae bacterium]
MNTEPDGRPGAAGGVTAVPGLKHRLFEVAGGPMSVYEAGPADRPSVVLLHGAMYDEARFVWDQLFPHLTRSYHLFAVDTPRHGRSRPWSGFLGRQRLNDILHATVARLGLARFSFVGLSMGGGLAIDYAAEHPEQVAAMALFEPGGLGAKLDKQFITWLYTLLPGALRYLNRSYAKKDDAAILKLLSSLYVGGSRPTDPDRLVALLKAEIKGKHDHAENDLDDWQLSFIGPLRLKWTLLDRLPLLRCPTLWLRGADSALVKQDEMERAVALARTGGSAATLQVVGHAGHLLPLERPAEATAAVQAFLDATLL